MSDVYALSADGSISICRATPENRGRGRCPHVTHQQEGEDLPSFLERASAISLEGDAVGAHADAVPDDGAMQRYLDEIDAMAGERVTEENLHDVMQRMTPEQLARLTQIGFEAAPAFSLPVRGATPEEYEAAVEENQLFFATLPDAGVAGKQTAIKQMFHRIGSVPTAEGVSDIDANYMQGLTPHQYFEKEFSARQASVAKSISVSKPGYAVWAEQDVWTDRGHIAWRDLQVGDRIMPSGDTVTHLSPWSQKPCYDLDCGHGLLTVSADHLILINRPFLDAASQRARDAVKEPVAYWACASAIAEFMQRNPETPLHTHDQKRVLSATPHNAGIPAPCRCISTDTGKYGICGFENHNTQRLLFYAMSDVEVIQDCGGPHVDALHCKAPNGGVCEKCAAASGRGDVRSGDLIGSIVSTNLAEPLVQISMKSKHSVAFDQMVEISRKV